MRQTARSLNAHLCNQPYSVKRRYTLPEAVDRFLDDPRNHPNDLRSGVAESFFASCMRFGCLTPDQLARMLANGADPTARDWRGDLAAMAYAHEDAATHLVALLDAGIDLHAANKDGTTLLHAAAERAGFGATLLMRHVDKTLDWRDRQGRSPLAAYLFRLPQSGKQPNLGVLSELILTFGMTPIDVRAALSCYHLNVLRLMVEYGADLNTGMSGDA